MKPTRSAHNSALSEKQHEFSVGPLHSASRISGSVACDRRHRPTREGRQIRTYRQTLLSHAANERLQQLDAETRRQVPQSLADLLRHWSRYGTWAPSVHHFQPSLERAEPVQPFIPGRSNAANYPGSRGDHKLGNFPLHSHLYRSTTHPARSRPWDSERDRQGSNQVFGSFSCNIPSGGVC